MKLYKTVVLSLFVGFAIPSQAALLNSEHSAKNAELVWQLTPTEDTGEDEHEESLGECILWPGCIVLPSSQTTHK
jgi:hypothetical protein